MRNKSIKVGTIAFFMGSLFLATAHASAVPTLADNMKMIGKLFKEITTNVADATQSQKLAADATQMVTLFTLVKTQVPESLADLPADQKAAMLTEFQGMIQEEIDHAKALEKAFQAGDVKAASAVITDMGDLKKEGHGKFAD